MFQKAIAIVIVLLASLFVVGNSFAQGNGGGPCLLGVGNCPPGGGNQQGSVDPGNGTRYYDGRIAQEILRASNYGSRYLLVLNRYWDSAENCYVEERAWVSGIRATSNDGRVAVTVGPSRKVLLRNNPLTTEQVNSSEAWLQYSRNEIYKWLKYQEQVAPYLNDPTYKQWAQNEYQRASAWIDYYKKYIANLQAGVATSAP
jgi:hypothetical protein